MTKNGCKEEDVWNQGTWQKTKTKEKRGWGGKGNAPYRGEEIKA